MADLSKPEVATVIPVLNEAESIIKCLDSLCNQSYPSELHQIYVFDGGSSDNTYQIVEILLVHVEVDPSYICTKPK